MTPERYQKVKALFYAARKLEPQACADLLSDNCNGDSELRNAVEELLASAGKVEAFIEKPAYAVIAHTLAGDVTHSPVEGKRIGQYQVVRKLGEGGMGAVYLAQRADDLYQKQVAIKLIRRGFDNSELLRRFYTERQILAALDHPNIARLLDGGTTEDGVPYYVMEYVEGRPLLEYCDEQGVTNEGRLKLFRTVCSAVQHAHQNLIIHRDLKPNNILVTSDGNPKLLDFGIAKVFQPHAEAGAIEVTVTDLRVMTPEYASPEQIIGQPVTTASDIYSLGVIFYQLLTGQRPYRFRSHLPQDIAKAICETEPEKPSAALKSQSLENGNGQPGRKQTRQVEAGDRHLRGDLDNIALMALRKEPQRRYATVEQFSEDIRRHLQGLPVIARRDTFAYRTSKFVRRNRYGVMAAALVVGLLLAGVVGIIRQSRIVAAERDRARTEQVKAERINKFYQDMLARANSRWYAPGSGKKADVTVIDALNEASSRIEHELNDEPAVKAEILTTIGDTYGALGRPELSERPFQLALNLRRSLFANNHIKVAESLYYLAGAKSLTGKVEEAESLYKQALDIQRQRPSEGNNLPYMLLEYGALLKGKNDQAALSHYREALAIFQQRNGPEHITVGVARDYIGKLNLERGDFEKAEAEYREAIRLFGNEQNTYLAKLHERLGQILATKKIYHEAESQMRRALELYLLTYDGNDWNSVAVKMQLENIVCLKGQCPTAKAEMEKIFATQKTLLDPNSKEFSSLLFYLGIILTKNGEPKRAESYLRESIRIWSAIDPSKPSASLGNGLGECLLAQGRYAEAEPLLLAWHNAIKSDVPHSPRIKAATENLQKLYQEWGKPAKY
ncbi:MAG TPA: tetratricopeptide repeat protein [Pyrinomonadaceae bacterium]|nr:tetratricopeptide repeat protein [Pyrinomonadaceae bacterium]